jgi:hypothetical protein
VGARPQWYLPVAALRVECGVVPGPCRAGATAAGAPRSTAVSWEEGMCPFNRATVPGQVYYLIESLTEMKLKVLRLFGTDLLRGKEAQYPR